ncbi:serine/threonine-protein kinase KIN2, partial [Nowakowskiella sp. JEL0407]
DPSTTPITTEADSPFKIKWPITRGLNDATPIIGSTSLQQQGESAPIVSLKKTDFDEIEQGGKNLSSPETLASSQSNFKKKSFLSLKDIQGKRCLGPWVLGKTIGEGASAKAKLAINYYTGEKCVVKAVRRPMCMSPSSEEEYNRLQKKRLYIVREACIGLCLQHENIAQLVNVYEGEYHFYCFFEYVEGEDMVDYVQRMGRLRERKARSIMRQLLNAIEYAHRNHVVHRDIKLENMRYCSIKNKVKVLDFGFAAFHSDTTFLETNCGSPCYAAPEIYLGDRYKGPEVDVWSLGICLFTMVAGTLPFDGSNFKQLSARVKKAKLCFPPDISQEVKHLISRMLTPNPKNRAPLHEVLQHAWINETHNQIPVGWANMMPPRLASNSESNVKSNSKNSSIKELLSTQSEKVIKSRSSTNTAFDSSTCSSDSLERKPNYEALPEHPVFNPQFVEHVKSLSVQKATSYLLSLVKERSTALTPIQVSEEPINLVDQMRNLLSNRERNSEAAHANIEAATLSLEKHGDKLDTNGREIEIKPRVNADGTPRYFAQDEPSKSNKPVGADDRIGMLKKLVLAAHNKESQATELSSLNRNKEHGDQMHMQKTQLPPIPSSIPKKPVVTRKPVQNLNTTYNLNHQEIKELQLQRSGKSLPTNFAPAPRCMVCGKRETHGDNERLSKLMKWIKRLKGIESPACDCNSRRHDTNTQIENEGHQYEGNDTPASVNNSTQNSGIKSWFKKKFNKN